MNIFAFHDAYLEIDDFLENENDDEKTNFDIDSNASNANLLKLKQELNKLNLEKTQRDLTNVTIVA